MIIILSFFVKFDFVEVVWLWLIIYLNIIINIIFSKNGLRSVLMRPGNLKKDVLGFRKYKSIFFFTIIVLLLFFLILFLILSCQSYRGLRSDDVEFKSGKIKVAATIYPLFDLVRNVGDGRVDVIYIIRLGESPHVFEFTPEQAKKLESVSIIFKIGLGLDDWVDEGLGI